MTTQAVNPRTIHCSVCNKDLPLSDFFPSLIGPTTTRCTCSLCKRRSHDAHRLAFRAKGCARLRAAFGAREWTTTEAARALEIPALGAGAVLEGMQNDGLVRRVAVGRYVFADMPQPAATDPLWPVIVSDQSPSNDKASHGATRSLSSSDRSARLRAAFGNREWTSTEAARVLETKPRGAGAVLERMRNDGLIRRVSVGRYILVDTPAAPAALPPTSLPAPLQPAAPVALATPQPDTQPAAPGPLWLAIGPDHLFSLAHIVCRETDDRGNYTVMLSVPDTNKAGTTSPLVYQFALDTPRQLVSAVALVEGAQTDLRRAVEDLRTENDQLRRKVIRAEADRDAARELMEEERERTIAKVMQAVRAA